MIGGVRVVVVVKKKSSGKPEVARVKPVSSESEEAEARRSVER